MGSASQTFAQCLGHLDAAAHYDHVDILRGTLQVEVAHVAAHDVTFESQFVGRVTDEVKQLCVEHLLQFFG